MLTIDSKSFATVTAHALAEYPNECCGVLLGAREGENRTVSRVVQCSNVHATPATRYSIDPVELIDIQRDARETQLEIVGFYHSHPDHPATLSQTDLDEANWPNHSYFIISLNDRQVADTRAYLLSQDDSQKRFVEEPLSCA